MSGAGGGGAGGGAELVEEWRRSGAGGGAEVCSLMVSASSSWAELHHGSGGDNLSPGNRKTNGACLVNTRPSCGSPPPHRGELLVRGGGGGGTCPPSSSAVLSTRRWWFRTRRTAAGTNAWTEITGAKTTSCWLLAGGPLTWSRPLTLTLCSHRRRNYARLPKHRFGGC